MNKSQQYTADSTISPPTFHHHQNNKDITSISLPPFHNPSLKCNLPSPSLDSNPNPYDTTNQIDVAPISSDRYNHHHHPLPPPPHSSSSVPSSQQLSTEQNNYSYYRDYYYYYHNQDQQYHRSQQQHEQNGTHAPYSDENGNPANTSYSCHSNSHDNYHYNNEDYRYNYYPHRAASPSAPTYASYYSDPYRVQRNSFSMPANSNPNGHQQGHHNQQQENDDPLSIGKYKHKICRPPNAWILYRSARIAEIKNNGTHIGCTQANLSKQIAESWRHEPPEVKQKFDIEAERRKQQHEIKYPGYKFQPNKPGRRRKNRSMQSYSDNGPAQTDAYPSPPSPSTGNSTVTYSDLSVPQETAPVTPDLSRHSRASTTPSYTEVENIPDDSKQYSDNNEMYYYQNFPVFPSRKTSTNSEFSSIWKRPSFSLTSLSQQDSVEGSTLGLTAIDYHPGSSAPSTAEPSKASKPTYTTTDPASFASSLSPTNAQLNRAEQQHETFNDPKYRSFPHYAHYDLHDNSYQQQQQQYQPQSQSQPQQARYQSSEGSRTGIAHSTFQFQQEPTQQNTLPSQVVQSEHENNFSSSSTINEQPNYTLQPSINESQSPVYTGKESADNTQIEETSPSVDSMAFKEHIKSYSFP